MELASIDIVTDGEVRRESYSNRFANALEGIDLDNPGVALDRTGHENPVPRVVGEIHRTRPVEVRDAEFLRRNTSSEIKVTLPGPFTMTQQAQNEHYPDEESLAFAYADAVNEEARDLKRAGVDVIQIDEPYLQARPEQARAYGIKAIDRALAGIEGETALHICFGYGHIVKDKPPAYSFLEELNQSSVRQISVELAQPNVNPSALQKLPDKTVIIGVIDLSDDAGIETGEVVAGRIRSALKHIKPERLVIAPDCGMKYLSRETAFAKLQAMVAGAEIVRAELTG